MVEEYLENLNRRLTAFIEACPDLMFRLDKDGTIIECKSGTPDDQYIPKEIYIGRNILEVFSGNAQDGFRKGIDYLRNTGTSFIFDYSEMIEDKENFFEARMVPIKPISEKQIFIIIRNTTEQKKISERIHALNKTLEDIIDFLPDPTFVINARREVIAWNKAIEIMTGVKKEDILGKGDYVYSLAFYGEKRPILVDLLFEENLDIDKKYDYVSKIGDAYFTEVFLPDIYNGKGAYIWETASRLYDKDSNIAGAIEAIRDITSAKDAQHYIMEEKEKLQAILDNLYLGIMMLDNFDRIIYINPYFIRLFGYEIEEIPSRKKWFEKAYPDDNYRQKVIAAWEEDKCKIRHGEKIVQLFKVMCKDGSEKDVQFQATKLPSDEILIACEDMTEQIRIEKDLAHSQKMEAIGVLAGGIAHDFNNLLMGIQGNVSLMLFKLDHNHPDYRRLTAIEDIVKNGAMLTQQLLDFSRGAKVEVKPLDANDVIKGTVKMFRRMKKEISIRERYDDELNMILANPGQLEQILMNLFINAWQAMKEGSEICVETNNVYLNKDVTELHLLPPGDYIMISVSDTGSGMDAKTMEKIFDPFFTTKEMGKGTGLGLTIVYGIVKNYKGFIDVKSELGKGTTFKIYLPVSQRLGKRDIIKKEGMEKGKETILLIDDEETILEVGRELLEALGYKVYPAKGGDEGLKIYGEKNKEIDLVILDMIMPGKGGEETFRGLKEIRPDVRVMLASGYTVDGVAEGMMEQGCQGFIQKPFNLKELSQRVREVLDK